MTWIRATHHRGRGRMYLWLLGAATLIAIGLSARYLHPFLAIDAPVRANVLVVEGWLPEYALECAAAEIRQGGYEYVVISGMTRSDGSPSGAARADHFFRAEGFPPAQVIVATVPETRWNRTSTMARAVRDRLVALKITPTGANVLSLGPHARQSLLAYTRMLGPNIPVGVIQVPKTEYHPAVWWATITGVTKTFTHFAGWAREATFGLRS